HSNSYDNILSCALDASDNILVSGGGMPPFNFGLLNFTNMNQDFFVLSVADNACQALGRVYRDYNNNASLDGTDAGLPNVMLQATGGYYAMSSQHGDYQFFTLPGTYNINIPNPPL